MPESLGRRLAPQSFASIFILGGVNDMKIARIFLVLIYALAATRCLGAPAAQNSILVSAAGSSTSLTAADIEKLPSIQLKISFGTDHGKLKAIFSGPLLWNVLGAAHAVDPTNPKLAVRGYVLVSGSDGYRAVIALGEIAPAFENKQVLLAETMNGKPLQAGHFRVVVPGDARGGRSVRDVVSIAVLSPPAP